LFNKILSLLPASNKRVAIIRVQYGRHGQALIAKVKISSGDPLLDQRGIEFVKKSTYSTLHHPGKQKGVRQSQWFDIRYSE
jgi:outer membrane biosynthesis protein TonB